MLPPITAAGPDPKESVDFTLFEVCGLSPARLRAAEAQRFAAGGHRAHLGPILAVTTGGRETLARFEAFNGARDDARKTH
ncbi:MAG TPA: hypothetical protein VMX16_01135 [Terriglobia bacterium]|nr:hypothetical protein [Terriglobia bacterium]